MAQFWDGKPKASFLHSGQILVEFRSLITCELFDNSPLTRVLTQRITSSLVTSQNRLTRRIDSDYHASNDRPAFDKELLFTFACSCFVELDLCYPCAICSCEAFRSFHIGEHCYHTWIRRVRMLIPFAFIHNPYFQLCSPRETLDRSSINKSRNIK